MPMPDPATFCAELDPLNGFKAGSFPLPFDPSKLKITMPGGAELAAAGAKPQKAVDQLIAALAAALTPLTPIFNVLDAVLLAAKVIDKLKSFDIAGAAKTFPPFLKSVDRLKSLVPQVSVPVMIVDTIDALIAFLRVLRAQLVTLSALQVKIDDAHTKAAQLSSSDLETVANCASSQLAAELAGLQATTKPLNKTVELLNVLCDIIGIPKLPTLDLSGSVSDALVAVDLLLTALTDVRALIPV